MKKLSPSDVEQIRRNQKARDQSTKAIKATIDTMDRQGLVDMISWLNELILACYKAHKITKNI